MLLIEYIERVYGTERGNKAKFLKDNPTIMGQELSRWLKKGYKLRTDTGEIYTPTSKRVAVAQVNLLLPIIEVNNIGVDTLSRCPYCNSVVLEDDAVLIKHSDNGQISVAHYSCHDESSCQDNLRLDGDEY
ncbi:hypothetical protein OKZ62_001894 [Vibrio navarrensis]|nr:hypothetical protein [Vibrio navarrensis]